MALYVHPENIEFYKLLCLAFINPPNVSDDFGPPCISILIGHMVMIRMCCK